MSELQLQTGTGVDLSLPLAGAGSRAYAYLIDWHIRVGVVLVWVLCWLLFSWPFEVDGLLDDRNTVLWLIIAPSTFYLLYHPVLELLLRGDSPGKRWVGLHCVDAAGNPPGSGAILLRNVLRIVDSLPAFYTVGLIAVIVNNERQRLGDMVAGTRVVLAATDSARALEHLSRIDGADLAPPEAELVAELLTRWRTLNKARRQQLATTLLQRVGIEPEQRDAHLRRQLEGLLPR